jgi:hypothetical protein
MSGIFGGGGGGGQSAPAQQTVTQQNAVSSFAAPYVENMLGQAQGLTNANMTYQPYQGQRTADFTGLQNQAFQGAQDLGVTGQTGLGSNVAGMAGLGALNVAGQANPQGFQNQVGGYMNPYLQMSLAPQLAEANRMYDIEGTKQAGAATQAGAFGGSRDAIMAAENERNRNMGLNSIIGQGFNNAFNAAQNQYNQNNQTQLAGLGAATSAANTLGQLGQNQYAQQTGNINLQNQLGTQQQQQQQNVLNQQYQDFQAQKQNPYNQLSFMQSMLSGLPLQSSTQNVYSNPNMLTQVAGLGLTGVAAKNAGLFAKGGKIKEDNRPAGLAELAIHRMA